MTMPGQPVVVPMPHKPKRKPGKSRAGDESQNRPEWDGQQMGITQQLPHGIFNRVQAIGEEVVGTETAGDRRRRRPCKGRQDVDQISASPHTGPIQAMTPPVCWRYTRTRRSAAWQERGQRRGPRVRSHQVAGKRGVPCRAHRGRAAARRGRVRLRSTSRADHTELRRVVGRIRPCGPGKRSGQSRAVQAPCTRSRDVAGSSQPNAEPPGPTPPQENQRREFKRGELHGRSCR